MYSVVCSVLRDTITRGTTYHDFLYVVPRVSVSRHQHIMTNELQKLIFLHSFWKRNPNLLSQKSTDNIFLKGVAIGKNIYDVYKSLFELDSLISKLAVYIAKFTLQTLKNIFLATD